MRTLSVFMAVFLSIILVCISLAACGDDDNEQTSWQPEVVPSITGTWECENEDGDLCIYIFKNNSFLKIEADKYKSCSEKGSFSIVGNEIFFNKSDGESCYKYSFLVCDSTLSISYKNDSTQIFNKIIYKDSSPSIVGMWSRWEGMNYEGYKFLPDGTYLLAGTKFGEAYHGIGSYIIHKDKIIFIEEKTTVIDIYTLRISAKSISLTKKYGSSSVEAKTYRKV